MYSKPSYNSYLSLLKYDFITKYNLNNHFLIPQFDYMILSLTNSNRDANIKQLLHTILFLEITTLSKPSLIVVKKFRTNNKIKIKIKKNFILGCKVILRKNYLFNFLTFLLFFFFPSANFKINQITNLNFYNQPYISYTFSLTELKSFNLYSLFYLQFEHLDRLTIFFKFKKPLYLSSILTLLCLYEEK